MPQTKRWSVLVNFRNGSATSAKSGKNFDEYWTRPRNDLTLVAFCSGSAFRIAATFSSLGYTPDLLRSCPKNVRFGSLNWHFFLLSVKPHSHILFNMAYRRPSCSFTPLLCTIKLSRYWQRLLNRSTSP